MPLEMEKFNINELAGATGLILGAVSGILVVIFKSRCYCKFRVGFSDKCNLCMCERKPPPDGVNNDSDDEKDKSPKKDLKKSKDIESLIPDKSPKKEVSQNIKFDIDDKDNLM